MTPGEAQKSMRRLYWLTTLFGLAGFVFYALRLGMRPALGFLLGAAGSLGNLWLFHWLTRMLEPKAEDGADPKKAWPASLFVGRYIVFIAVGYTTVKALDVSPVPVLFGLLASTAAVLTSSIADVVLSFAGKRSSP